MSAKKQQLTVEEIHAARDSLKKNDADVGSTPAQVATLTARIIHLTKHIGANRNDKHSRRGLIGMVSKRRRLLKYLKRTDAELYGKTLSSLGLRK